MRRQTLILLAAALALSAVACGGQAAATATTVPEIKATGVAVVVRPVVVLPPPTPAPTPTPPPNVGLWNVHAQVSQVDDTTNAWASLTGWTFSRVVRLQDEGIDCWIERWEGSSDIRCSRPPPWLGIDCLEGPTSLYVFWGYYLGIDDPEVTYRIDDAAADTRRWTIWTGDTSSTSFPGPQASVLAFINELLKADALMVSTPYKRTSITAAFDLTGMENAVEGMRAACGW